MLNHSGYWRLPTNDTHLKIIHDQTFFSTRFPWGLSYVIHADPCTTSKGSWLSPSSHQASISWPVYSCCSLAFHQYKSLEGLSAYSARVGSSCVAGFRYKVTISLPSALSELPWGRQRWRCGLGSSWQPYAARGHSPACQGPFQPQVRL